MKLIKCIGVWFGVIVVFIGFAFGLKQSLDELERKTKEKIYANYQLVVREGINAYRSGVNPEANPYTFSEERKAWLDGWMRESDNDKQSR